MVLSSSFGRLGRDGGVEAVVAEQGPEDVDAAAGQGDHRLCVGATLAALFEVVVAVAGPSRVIDVCADR